LVKEKKESGKAKEVKKRVPVEPGQVEPKSITLPLEIKLNRYAFMGFNQDILGLLGLEKVGPKKLLPQDYKGQVIAVDTDNATITIKLPGIQTPRPAVPS